MRRSSTAATPACVYFTPIVGGVIADRWLGKRRAVIIGGAIMALGHFMMAFEPLFYPALATIALGNGLFLPSLPSQIDGLYPRRRSAPRARLQHLLRRHEPRRVPGAAGLRHAGRDCTAGTRVSAPPASACSPGWLIYLAGAPLPAARPARGARGRRLRAATARRPRAIAFALLLGIAAIVVVFRGAYEQVGNTLRAVGRQRRGPARGRRLDRSR